MKVSIIGNGWVGKGMQQLFPDALVYVRDTHQDKEAKFQTSDKDLINSSDVAFICVPSPCPNKGELDTSAVEEVVSWCTCPLLVMRSTVNPGTCDTLSRKYNRQIVMQPEYLGETPQHPLLNTKNTPFMILGGEPESRRKLIELYTTVFNANVTIRQTTALEAEVIKLSENRAILFMTDQCQELYDVCEKAGVDYYTVRDAVYGDDPRFNLWWTFIYPEKRGCVSKCIPKDPYAWCAWAESCGYNPILTRTLLAKNEEWIKQNEAVSNHS